MFIQIYLYIYLYIYIFNFLTRYFKDCYYSIMSALPHSLKTIFNFKELKNYHEASLLKPSHKKQKKKALIII